MSERKVLNKYYPPDFDPTNIPRLKLPKARQYTVRVMTPCNMKCNTCGDYIAKAKKFNARKETVEGEEYKGLKIYRFYFKCPICMAEITFKTDPKNQDYELEHGATRNFQAYRLAQMQAEKEANEAEEEEKLNPMKMLENRTKASKREMQELEDLEELKELSQRTVNMNTEEFLGREKERKKKFEEMLLKQQQEEDEAEMKSLLEEQNRQLLTQDQMRIRRSKWIKLEGTDEQVEVSDEEEEEVEKEEEKDQKNEDVSVKKESTVDDSKCEQELQASSSEAALVPQNVHSGQAKLPNKPWNELLSIKKSSHLKRKLDHLVKVVVKKKTETADSAAAGLCNSNSASRLSSLCSYSDSGESDDE